MNWYVRSESWIFIVRSYLPRLMLCSLVWEIAQMPLYTMRAEPRLRSFAFAVAHCTVGDAVIGTSALIMALTLSRAGERTIWPRKRIGWLMILLAIAYTLPSERINLADGNWAYSTWMPVVPWVDVGLAPVMQWTIVPLVTWWWANRQPFRAHGFR
ncbi:MAG: hypothetical protein JSS44_01465 [Proteobacteria bacterium]|nr:hypothetical protein [Pseudomonadota bacterium]